MDRPLRGLKEDEALKLILEGTSGETGHGFFRALVKALASALRTQGAWVTRLDAQAGRLDAFALWLNGEWVDDYGYAIAGTPCEIVIEQCRPLHVPENVVRLFPDDPDLARFDSVSYLGVPLVDPHGEVIGNLAVLDSRPMPEDPRAQSIIEIFAARAAAEVSRLRVEDELRSREEQLHGLVDSALDAILQLDVDLRIVRANPASQQIFGVPVEPLLGKPFTDLLSSDSASKLRRHVRGLDAVPSARPSTWISGGLEAIRADGSSFRAEASLARFTIDRAPAAGRGADAASPGGGDRFLTVILRDVNDRLEAERQIATLREQTDALREELAALGGSGEILGGAPCLLEMLRDVGEVAPTDATVLIQGETGTGKELVARAIHAASSRRDRPLVKLNCGAIPSTLIESELFGHEKGAYTGATSRREGRFLTADRGTLFLDEVGELPLDLQVKLLRVLQEGEFEPVGSSRTRKVDVRVIAATNRDLASEVGSGRFRGDLYYRLNVFPIPVPPLRDRKEDIPLLAAAFTARVCAKIGRRIEGVSAQDLARLKSSDWPGNVRELQNVIERAVITSRDGRLNLDRALPSPPGSPTSATGDRRVRTAGEIEALERGNVLLALEQTGWKVAGDDGAAALLGLKPSTLSSRMRALGIKRPR